MSGPPQVRVFPTTAELFGATADIFCQIGEQAIRDRGRYTVALSGGNTPRGLHQELVTKYSARLNWEKVFFFWGDERHVPPDFPESNYRMAKETLLSKLSIPGDHIFRMPGELPDAEQGAAIYEQTLREGFPRAGEFPRLDFILLGIGPDGHTASLFPDTKALQENRRWAVGNWVAVHSTWRITLTYPVLNHGANVMFLVEGGEKAEIVKTALQTPSAHLPSQGVKPRDGELMWYLDQAAGAKL